MGESFCGAGMVTRGSYLIEKGFTRSRRILLQAYPELVKTEGCQRSQSRLVFNSRSSKTGWEMTKRPSYLTGSDGEKLDGRLTCLADILGGRVFGSL